MAAEASRCCAARSGWCLGSGVGLGLAAALAPKCPLCVAGYLALLGLGTTVGLTVAELLVPSAALLAAALVAVGMVARRRQRSARAFARTGDAQVTPRR